MLKLVTFPPTFGMRNVSPFCLKTEMLLTQLGLEFEIVQQSDPRKSPKGKLPFVITDNGERIADSEIITEYIDGITNGKVYEGLSPEQKAHGVALARLIDDHLYWLMVASRWLDDAWWPHVKAGFFRDFPPVLKQLVPLLARRQVRQTCLLHGLGRHSFDEQQDFARRDLDALEHTVPASGFLFGDKPCIYDFTVAALMAGIYDNEPATWVTRIAQDYPGLKAYTERVQAAVGVYGRENV